MNFYLCPVCGSRMIIIQKWRESRYDFYAECFCQICCKYFRYEFKDNGWAGCTQGFREIGKLDSDFEEKSHNWGE